jgi:hypothetical protein
MEIIPPSSNRVGLHFGEYSLIDPRRGGCVSFFAVCRNPALIYFAQKRQILKIVSRG